MSTAVNLGPFYVKPTAPSSSSSSSAPQNQDCLFYFIAEPKFSHETGQLIGMLAGKNIQTESMDPSRATHFLLFVTKKLLETKEFLLPLMSRLVDPHFKERLFPILMDRISIFNPHDERPFVEYWTALLQNTSPQSPEYADIQTIAAGIAPLMRGMRDTLSFNLQELFQSNMQLVVNAVEQRAHLLKPKQFFFLPPSYLNQPIGIEPALFQLSAHFEEKTQVLISGEAQTGKSTLAIEYAKRATSYCGVFWIDASSKESIEEGFSQIAAQLGTSKEDAKRTLLRMDRFLLIYDNLKGGVSYSIFPNAHTLLVGTNIASPDLVTAHFTQEDAVRFITQELETSTADASLLATLLECHIGKLREAVDYIRATKISIQAYNDHYLNNRDQLLVKQSKRRERSKTVVGHHIVASILDPSPHAIARCQKESVDTLSACLKDLNIQIFVSYSWSAKDTVNQIDSLFTGLGLPLLRDTREVRPFNSLREFMRKVIRVADYTLSMVSDSYLLSFNCLFEVVSLMDDPCWRNRIFPLVLPGTDLSDQKIHSYEVHWEQEAEKFEKLGSEQDALIARSGVRKLGAYLRFVRERRSEEINDQLKNRFHNVLALMVARQERLEKKGLYSQAIFHLPMGRNKDFIGRDKELKALEEALKTNQSGSITHTGMGGIGKSQLALEYAYRHEKEYEMIYWVRAEDLGTLQSEYRQLGQEMGLSDDFLTDEKVIATVKGELEKRNRWLIIFDNADDPKVLAHAVPQKGGHVVITSRNPDWPNALRLELFTEQESIDYVRKLTAIVGQDNELSQLAKELGYLPLALTQAAAYIRRQEIDVATYLKSYKDHLSNQEKGYPGSVATAWLMSMEKILVEEPVALILLNICSLLEPDNIPDTLLVSWLKPQSPRTNDLDFQDALRVLESYSLIHQRVVIEGDTQRKFISIHRLIQMVTQDQCPQDRLTLLISLGVAVLATHFSGGFRTPEERQHSSQLIGHCLSVVKHAEAQNVLIKEALTRLLGEIGEFMQGTNHYSEARAAFEKSLALQDGGSINNVLKSYATFTENIASISNEIAEASGSSQQPGSSSQNSVEPAREAGNKLRLARTYHKLGQVFRDDGKLQDAKKLFEKAIAMMNELGNDASHTTIFNFYDSYINVLYDLGQFQEAKKIREVFRERLAQTGDQKDDLLDAHYQTSLSIHLSEEGDLLGAKKAAERGLELHLKHHGNQNHSDVAGAYSTLGSILSALSQYKEARVCYEKALKMKIAIKGGEDNEDVSQCYSNYALVLHHLGEFDNAKVYYENALKLFLDCHKTDKHQGAAAIYGNLAAVARDLGNYQSAILMYKKSIDISKEVIGSEDHIEILSSYGSLGTVYLKLGDYQTGYELCQYALKNLLRVLGTDQHSEVARVYHHLSIALKGLKQPEAAMEMQRKSESISKIQFGTEVHSDIASSYNNMGTLLHDNKNIEGAKEALDRSLDIDLKVYESENHPAVATHYANLSRVYVEKGDLPRAKESIEKAVSIMIAIKQDHLPDMAAIYACQAVVLQRLGDFKGGVVLCEKAMAISPDQQLSNLVNAYHQLANHCLRQRDFNNVVLYSQKALDLAPKAATSEKEYNVIPLLINIGEAQVELGDQLSAQETLAKVMQMVQVTKEKDKGDMANSYMRLASLNSELKDLTIATQMYQKALELFLEMNDSKNRSTIAIIYNNMGHHFKEAENYQRAKSAFEKCVEVNIELYGPDHPELANTYMHLASVNSDLNDSATANQMYQKALELLLKMNDPNERPNIATIYNNMGHLCFAAKDYQGAKDALMKCLEIKIQLQGEGHPEVARLYKNIGAVCSYLGDFEGAEEMRKKAETCGIATT